MASDLKKVGLIFKADGSADFTKTLKNINSELQQNYQNLKLTQAQYDKNTSSQQKLVDKLGYLNNAYDLQSSKVRVLEEDLKNLESAEIKDEVAINKKKTALLSAQTSLERYKKQIEEVSVHLKKGTANAEDFAKKLKESSGKIESAGKKVSVLSATTGALGLVGLKTATDFEYAMSSVSAISGATGEEFNKLKEKAKEMGASTKFTATEAANAMYYMSLAGWKTEDMLNGLEGIMYLAAASGEDLATVSDIVTDGLTAMGYAASDSTKMADVFAKTVTNSNTDVAGLGEAMEYTGSIAGALKLDMEDVSLALGLMANSGVKASQAGTSLRAILQRLSTDTSGARTSLENMGVKIFDSTGKMRDFGDIIADLRIKFSNLSDEQKTNIAKTVAGTTAMSGFLAIVNSSDADFNKLRGNLENASGAAKNMADTMQNNVKGQMTLLKSQLEGIAIKLSEHVIPILRKLLTQVQKLLTWFSKLSPTTQKIILVIAGFITILGPLLIIIGKIGTGVSALITVFTKLGPAFSLAGGFIKGFLALLTPTNLIIAAIVAGIILLGKVIFENWDKIVEKTGYFAEKFISFFQAVDDFIKNVFSIDFSESLGIIGDGLNSVIANLENFCNSFKLIFGGIIDFIKGVFTADWKLAWEGVKNIFSGIFNLLYSIAVSPLNLIIGAINTLISGLNFFIEQLNKIQVPDWVPKWGGKGINIPKIGKISYLAKGGELIKGTAIVGEAGPELLSNNGKSTKVMPLTRGGGATPVNVIDYNKLFNIFINALNSCKMKLDKDGFVRFVNDVLLEVV